MNPPGRDITESAIGGSIRTDGAPVYVQHNSYVKDYKGQKEKRLRSMLRLEDQIGKEHRPRDIPAQAPTPRAPVLKMYLQQGGNQGIVIGKRNHQTIQVEKNLKQEETPLQVLGKIARPNLESTRMSAIT